jgi:hypothetical protein
MSSIQFARPQQTKHEIDNINDLCTNTAIPLLQPKSNMTNMSIGKEMSYLISSWD